MMAIPLRCIVGVAEEIRLLLLEQDIQVLHDVLHIILAGHGDDDVRFDQVQRVDVVVDVIGEGEFERFEQLRHAPTWPFEEEAHFGIGLREERVDVGGVNLIMPAHGF